MYGSGKPSFASVNRENYQPRFGNCTGNQQSIELGMKNKQT